MISQRIWVLYFCLLALALGSSVASAAPVQGNQAQQQVNSDAQVRALERIAKGVEEANRPSILEKNCTPGQTLRTSDLCAQWSAADAAKSASRASWLLGSLALLISALTLVAAFFAGKYAKEAAKHTEAGAAAARDGVLEARRIGEAQVRCYLSGVSAKVGFVEGDLALINVLIRNTGQSPAIDVFCTGYISFTVEGKTTEFRELQYNHKFCADIGAGTEQEVGFTVKASPRGWGPPTAGAYFITARVEIFAKDIFGEGITVKEKFVGVPKVVPELNAWTKMGRTTEIRD